jgi:peptidoglycan hydrolase-like protein with peptidoglycan-binding domain
MQFGRIVLSSSLLLLTMALNADANAMTHARRGPTSPKLFKKKSSGKPGQRTIDSARTTEIQSALIKSGYLSGEPTGTWDAKTASAMEKLQADNGWQTKIVPDSRAIIKLGLGPNQTNVATGQ